MNLKQHTFVTQFLYVRHGLAESLTGYNQGVSQG